MQRRRFLAGAVGGAVAGLAGCMAAGEGEYARRVAVNATVGSDGGQATAAEARDDQGLHLLDHGFYRRGSSAGIRGTAANRGTVALDFIAAYARLFDRSGTEIQRTSDYDSGIPVGERWRFDAPLLDADPARVARYQLVVMDQRTSEVDPFAGET